MSDSLRVGIVGLGVMGLRMLERLDAHPRFEAVVGLGRRCDCRRAGRAERHPEPGPGTERRSGASAPRACTASDIATPPSAHMALSNRAFDAGLAVFCEKPLTVDFDAARQTIGRIDREGHRAAVNFSLASSPGLAALQAAWREQPAGLLGEAQDVRIELAFAAWPRPWQMAAGAWLSERAEGGFTREVLSHFVFVLQRLLGPAEVQTSQPVYPSDDRSAETALSTRLEARGLPIAVDARVAGDVADFNRLTLRGSAGEIELRDWFGVHGRRQGAAWEPLGDPPKPVRAARKIS